MRDCLQPKVSAPTAVACELRQRFCKKNRRFDRLQTRSRVPKRVDSGIRSSEGAGSESSQGSLVLLHAKKNVGAGTTVRRPVYRSRPDGVGEGEVVGHRRAVEQLDRIAIRDDG